MISDEDADVDIVRAAVQQSTMTDTTVICEDTDILILLLHHASSKEHVIYMRSDINKKQRHTYNIKKNSKFYLVKIFADPCSLFMRLQDVTPPQEFSALGRKESFKKR